MPAPVSAEQVIARGVHPDCCAGKKCSAFCASVRARLRGGNIGAIGFVHGNQIGQLHHAPLDSLQLIACARQRDQQEKIHHGVHCGL